MQCNHLDGNRTRRDPTIARFWDALVAEPDNTHALNDVARTSKLPHNFGGLS
jgi:hypothetical protein